MNRTFLNAVDFALPDQIVTNADLARDYPNWDMERTAERGGVVSRRIAGPDETALDLGLAACRALEAREELSSEGVDALIFCTETPDHPIPPNACILHKHLGLRTDVMAFDITLACSGFVYAAGMARSLLKSESAKTVLVVAGDTYSRLIHPGDRAVRSLFGDGAAAAIFSLQRRGYELEDVAYGTSGEQYKRFIVRAGGARHPRRAGGSLEETDRSGNVRTAEHISMDGLGVLSFFNAVIPGAVDAMLARHSLGRADVDCYIFHQASRIAVESIARALKLSPAQVYFDISEIGNLVAASVPTALRQAELAGRVPTGSRVLLCGFGVGLSWATSLMRAV